jgi:hypothetical protein
MPLLYVHRDIDAVGPPGHWHIRLGNDEACERDPAQTRRSTLLKAVSYVEDCIKLYQVSLMNRFDNGLFDTHSHKSERPC